MWLFNNDNHTPGDSRPFMTGNGEISKETLKMLIDLFKDGTDVVDGILKVDCTGWENTSKAGKPYTFVTFTEKYHNPNKEEAAPKSQDDDLDIPF